MKFSLLQLLIGIAVVAVVVWLLSPREVLILDGRFFLAMESDGSMRPQSVAYCWNEEAAIHAVKYGNSTNEISFYPVEQLPDGTSGFDIPFSEKQWASGREISYHEPKYIVIQFDSGKNDLRKMFRIPVGRGNRSIELSVRPEPLGSER